MLQAIALVMVGAAVGGAARFLVTHIASDLSRNLSGTPGFPYGTLVVNVVGSLLVGYMLTWVTDHEDDRWRLLAATGFCGGFTTFSAYAFETMAYLREGRLMAMAANIALNNILACVALLLGIWLHQTFK